MDRRSFVQFAVGAAAAGAVAASALAMARPLVIPRLGGASAVQYFGTHRTAGPAPRGLPLIPIRLNGNNVFEGVPFVQTGVTVDEETGEEVAEGINVLEWYKYCGHSGAPGLSLAYPNDQNALKFFIAEEKIAQVNPWYRELLGELITPDDFPDDEFGAGFVWRSEGQSGPDVLTGAIVRYETEVIRRLEAGLVNPAKSITEEEFELLRTRFFVERGESTYVAFSTFCTHFCCIPGYKEAEKLARPRNAWDKVFCTCHNSVYDPREPVSYTFFPEPVADEGEAAAGGAAH